MELVVHELARVFVFVAVVVVIFNFIHPLGVEGHKKDLLSLAVLAVSTVLAYPVMRLVDRLFPPFQGAYVCYGSIYELEDYTELGPLLRGEGGGQGGRLVATKAGIILYGAGLEIKLCKGEVSNVSRVKRMAFDGIRIFHDKKEYKPHILFSPLDAASGVEPVLVKLREMGYQTGP